MSHELIFDDVDNDNEFDDGEFDDPEFDDAGSWTDDSNCFPSDDNQELAKDMIIENEYHSAYYSIKEDPINARKAFEQVIALCDDYDENTAIDSVLEFRFKALTQTVKLLLKNEEEDDDNNASTTTTTMEYYKKLLASIDGVSSNEMQNAIVTVLSMCDNKFKDNGDNDNASDLYYDTTLSCLHQNGKYSLWFKIGMIRCNNLMTHQKPNNNNNNKERTMHFLKCKELIDRIHHFVVNELSKSPSKKDGISTELLQVYCIKIELIMNAIDHGISNNSIGGKLEMLTLIDLSKELMDNGGGNGIIDVGSTAVINECLAKYVYCPSDNWNLCHSHFQNSFVSYSSIAVKKNRSISNLKYFLVSYCILQCKNSDNSNNNHEIPNPFSMNEVCVYEMNHAILNMKTLVNSLESNDINAFNRCLNIEMNAFAKNDPFLLECLKKLQLEFQGKVLINLAESYTRMKLKWLSIELEMDVFSVEKLIVKLIIDGRIYAKLDQVNSILIMDKYPSLDGGGNAFLVKNMVAWMGKVTDIKNSLCNKSGRKDNYNNRSFSAYGAFDGHDDDYRTIMDDYDDEFLLSAPFAFVN